ncbi:hypothetical protein EI94DRAFT_1796996 [Lactarius quietus]|nr:hypothetical protein EI94DRAFT_1796996 [Lactarius quietus]
MHLISIMVVVKVPTLEDPNVDEDAFKVARYPPRGPLALLAAAIKRTLTLYAQSKMQFHSVRKQASKLTVKAMLKHNQQSGVLSIKDLQFFYGNWGKPTLCYLKSIEEMRKGSLQDIVIQAQKFIPMQKQLGYQSFTSTNGNEDNMHVCLVDKW